MRLTTKTIIYSVIAVLAVVGVILAIFFATHYFQRGTADFRGETSELEQLKADPAHRISARQYFFDTCTQVQGFEDTIRALRTELEGDPSESREEQINGAITANQAQRDNLIRDYNGHAQNFTFQQFRSADLPERLEVDAESTKCVAGD